MKNVLEWLEQSEKLFPNKTVFADENKNVSYAQFGLITRSIGTEIATMGLRNKPIVILINRSVEQTEAMMGIAYSGNFYTVLDTDMPLERMNHIVNSLDASLVICDDNQVDKAEQLLPGRVMNINGAVTRAADGKVLEYVRNTMCDADPLYVLFTSGSTGNPKGVVVTHRNVISYIEWFADTFDINRDTIFGSQTPLYFSMSVSDVFSTMAKGATLHLIPKSMFSFPMNLVEHLNKCCINTIYWVPSALSLLANWKIFQYKKAETIKKVLFAGESMPTRQLNYWIDNIPDAMYANLFGPTESTDICTYYILDRKFKDTEPIPMGKACNNCDVFVLDDNGQIVFSEKEEKDKVGELYIRGSFVVPGYYNDKTKTGAAFVQNPLNTCYPETVYKTGDLVRYNKYGELEYVSRRDFQIKHMGYRIELGEIESAASSKQEVSACVTLYDKVNDQIVLVFEGKKVDDCDWVKYLSSLLPPYMMPGKYIRVRTMPHNQNGKIDRSAIKRQYNID